MQLGATIASEMAPDDGCGDEGKAPHQEHTAAQPRRQNSQGSALKTGRIVSHSSDVNRDTPGVTPGASNSRDAALQDRIWAVPRFIVSPIVAILSTIFDFVQRRMVRNSSSFKDVVADRRGRPVLQKIKPETQLAVGEVKVAPGIILGALSLEGFRFITSLLITVLPGRGPSRLRRQHKSNMHRKLQQFRYALQIPNRLARLPS